MSDSGEERSGFPIGERRETRKSIRERSRAKNHLPPFLSVERVGESRVVPARGGDDLVGLTVLGYAPQAFDCFPDPAEVEQAMPEALRGIGRAEAQLPPELRGLQCVGPSVLHSEHIRLTARDPAVPALERARALDTLVGALEVPQ